jgi:hypothetical protein
MVRIHGQAFWLFVPALTDIVIGGKPFEGFQSFGEVISHQERVEVLLQVLRGLIIVFFDHGVLARSIHMLHLAIRPGMQGFGQPLGNAVLITYLGKEVCEGILILLPICKLDAVIGQYGVKFVRSNSATMAPELCRHRLAGFRVPLSIHERRVAVDGDKQV